MKYLAKNKKSLASAADATTILVGLMTLFPKLDEVDLASSKYRSVILVACIFWTVYHILPTWSTRAYRFVFWFALLFRSKLHFIMRMISVPPIYWEAAINISSKDLIAIAIWHAAGEVYMHGGSPDVYVLAYIYKNGSIRTALGDSVLVRGLRVIRNRLPIIPALIMGFDSFLIVFNPNLSSKNRQQFILDEKAIHRAFNEAQKERYKFSVLNREPQFQYQDDGSG